jgi:hypothetical protein
VLVQELLLFEFSKETLRLGLLEFLTGWCVVTEHSQVFLLRNDGSWVATMGCEDTFIQFLIRIQFELLLEQCFLLACRDRVLKLNVGVSTERVLLRSFALPAWGIHLIGWCHRSR